MGHSHPQDALITVATFATALEARFARGALEAIGISAHVSGDSGGSFTGMSRVLPHRAELQVFESDRDRAILELRRLRIRIVPPLHDV